MRNNTISDFWKKVRKQSGTENCCWIWIAGTDEDDYGIFSWNNKTVRAARFVLEVICGISLGGLEACHTCDNPPCVRPDHLFAGTSGDNARDRDEKGRGLSGRGQTEEHISNRVVSRLLGGKGWTAEMKKQLSQKKTGTKHTTETRMKMSIARAGVERPDLSEILSGEGNGRAVLTEQLVAQMRLEFTRGTTKSVLARKYGVGETQVARIVTRQAWKHIP